MAAPEIRTRRVRANGLDFAVDEAGEGGDVALLLHGFPECRYSWRHQLPALAEAGWRAVAPDLRGYGDSDKPRGRENYRLEHLVADVAGLFDALGARRRLLVGHDWGAMVAWTFAIRRARPLDGLVILNVPHPAVFAQVLSRSWDQRRRSWYVAAFQTPVLPELALTAGRAWGIAQAFRAMRVDPERFPPEVLDVYRENALKPGAIKAMVDYYRANLVRPGQVRAWPRIETPTLMIWGEADRALGPELTHGYEPYVENLELQRLPGVSHFVQGDAPDEVNARLLSWLDRRGVARLS